MNKEQFLNHLAQRLNHLPEQDLFRLTEFFSETIDDRIEDGMSEEQAVAALGDPEQIIREILQENGGVPALRAPEPQNERTGSHFVATDPLHSICVETRFTDVRLRREPLSDGLTASVDGPEDMNWSLSGGVLSIQCDRNAQSGGKFSLQGFLGNLFNGFSFGDSELTVTLPEAALRDVSIHTTSGDISAENFALERTLEAVSVSGDVKLSSLSAGSDMLCQSGSGDVRLDRSEIHGALNLRSTSGDVELSQIRAGSLFIRSSSGDVEAQNVESTADMTAETVSGDAELSQIRTGSLLIRSSSGDVEIRNIESETGMTAETVSGSLQLENLNLVDELSCSTSSGDLSLNRAVAESIRANTVSGDLTLDHTSARVRCTLNTSSGDINLHAAEAADFEIRTCSGDIRGTLAGESSRYDFRCASRSGDVHIPSDRGERPVQAHSQSGDIHLRADD